MSCALGASPGSADGKGNGMLRTESRWVLRLSSLRTIERADSAASVENLGQRTCLLSGG